MEKLSVKKKKNKKPEIPDKSHPTNSAAKHAYFYRLSLANNSLVHIACLVFLILIIYSNTFNAPFQWDDREYIANNSIIKNLHYFSNPSEAEELQFYDAFINRYIGYLAFALDYRIHGLSVSSYHAVNIAIHIATALLVYFLVLLTFKTPFFMLHVSRFTTRHDLRSSIAFFSAAFFAVHPIQTEAVTYLFQRFASLVTLFYLLSLVMYIKFRLTTSSEPLSPPKAKSPAGKVILYVFCLFSAILAMKTKENAFTLPFVLLLYEFLFFSGPFQKRLWHLAPILMTLTIIPLSFMYVASTAGKPLSSIDPGQVLPRAEYLFTQFRVILTYLRLLFFPASQNIDYDYHIYHSFFEAPVLISFLFLSILFAVGVLFITKKKAKDQNPYLRLMGFGMLWFFITISIESSIIPIPMVINEYRLYLPSAGLIICAVTAVFILIDKFKDLKLPSPLQLLFDARSAGIILLALVIVVLSVATYLRNEVWGDDIRLWEDTAKKSPDNPRVHVTLGNVYRYHNMFDAAIEQYLIAVKLKPDYTEAYNNRGLAFHKIGQLDKAIADFDKAIALNSSFHQAYLNKGMVYGQIGSLDKAIEEFDKAIAIMPNFLAYSNRGLAYYLIGEYERSLADLNKAIELNKAYPEAYGTRGNVYLKTGNRELAISDFQEACGLGDEKGCDVLKAIGR